MALAPTQLSPVTGQFVEADYRQYFQYDSNSDRAEYPHRVWVSTPSNHDQGWRYARVLKTVAYVVVDEGADGDIVAKWSLTSHKTN